MASVARTEHADTDSQAVWCRSVDRPSVPVTGCSQHRLRTSSRDNNDCIQCHADAVDILQVASNHSLANVCNNIRQICLGNIHQDSCLLGSLPLDNCPSGSCRERLGLQEGNSRSGSDRHCSQWDGLRPAESFAHSPYGRPFEVVHRRSERCRRNSLLAERNHPPTNLRPAKERLSLIRLIS